MITSTGNAQVKQAAALVKKARYRNEQKLFVVEGPRMFGELPRERIVCAYVTERFLREPGQEKMLDGAERVELVSEEVLRAMSDTQTPQGVLALVRQYDYRLEDLLQESRRTHLVILEGVQDPGNLGTILRSGEGAGATGVIMDAQTADIYNPKVIRSTMGSVFRVPFVRVEKLDAALSLVKERGVKLFAAHLRGETSYDREDYTGDIGFLIGNEAAGLSAAIADMADAYVRIPMLGRVESLNAAVAASILMYEAARQRRSLGQIPGKSDKKGQNL